DLAAAVADKAGMSKSDANRAVEAVFGCISDAMRKGDEVRVLGFGNFLVADRAAGTGRNPQTGEAMQIKASKQAKFKPGKGLKDALNG
ncbi:MAG: HU family DNA-binding protein, partial [Rhizobiales bacterium]|nr:HU family DNA-binding protein [Hyphomicrobiales bacterium]